MKLADLMVRSGDTAAIELGQKRMEDLLTASPDNVDALNTLALSEIELSKPEDAERRLNEALHKLPQNLKSSLELATLYLSQNKPEDAENILKKAARQAPRNADGAVALGELYLLTRRWSEAEGEFRPKAADPHYVPADLALARADLAEGKLQTALVTLNHLVAAHDRDADAQFLLALADTRAGNYQAAIAQYRKALALNPGDPVALNNLAYLLADVADQPDEALPYAQRALEAAPENADIACTPGWIFYRKGLYQNAALYLQKSVSNDQTIGRNDAIRKFHLAMAYLKLGDRKRGTDVLASALQQIPISRKPRWLAPF